MQTLTPKFTLAELDQYLELKRKIQPETCEEFGHEWYGASVYEISTDDSPSRKEIQIELFKPFCAIALTLEQAKEFLEQQLAAIREVDINYMPDNKRSQAKSSSLLPS